MSVGGGGEPPPPHMTFHDGAEPSAKLPCPGAEYLTAYSMSADSVRGCHGRDADK